MSVMDELRAALEEYMPSWGMKRADAHGCAVLFVERFAAAHPGLVEVDRPASCQDCWYCWDYTDRIPGCATPRRGEVVQCGECMRLGRDVERGDDECSKAPLWCYELLFEPEDETFYCPHGHRKDTP